MDYFLFAFFSIVPEFSINKYNNFVMKRYFEIIWLVSSQNFLLSWGWRRVEPHSYMCSCEKGLATSVYKESKVGKARIQDKISGSRNSCNLLYLNPFHCSFERILKGSGGVCRALLAHLAPLSELEKRSPSSWQHSQGTWFAWRTPTGVNPYLPPQLGSQWSWVKEGGAHTCGL